MFFDSLIMFLQVHFILYGFIAAFFSFSFIVCVAYSIRNFYVVRDFKHKLFLVPLLLSLFDLCLLVCLSYLLISGSSSQRIINSMSSWTAPVKVNKLITDEVNTASDFNSAKVKYVVTDQHVYTLRHRNLISKRVVTTSKPTYVTYQHRVLKADATKFERQYFKTVQSGNVKTHGVQVKFGKLVNHKHVSSQQ